MPPKTNRPLLDVIATQDEDAEIQFALTLTKESWLACLISVLKNPIGYMLGRRITRWIGIWEKSDQTEGKDWQQLGEGGLYLSNNTDFASLAKDYPVAIRMIWMLIQDLWNKFYAYTGQERVQASLQNLQDLLPKLEDGNTDLGKEVYAYLLVRVHKLASQE